NIAPFRSIWSMLPASSVPAPILAPGAVDALAVDDQADERPGVIHIADLYPAADKPVLALLDGLEEPGDRLFLVEHVPPVRRVRQRAAGVTVRERGRVPGRISRRMGLAVKQVRCDNGIIE